MKEFLYQVLVQVPEPVYFSLFLIIGKNIKEKRLLFITIMIMQYLLLTHTIYYNVWLQIIYTFMSFVNLKVLYKEKSQVTDIFLFMIASIILIIVSLICITIQSLCGVSHELLLVINRIIIFSILFFYKNKINIIYQKYYALWNRHNNKTKIRSLTLRNISIIVFNLMFYIINLCLLYRMIIVK